MRRKLVRIDRALLALLFACGSGGPPPVRGYAVTAPSDAHAERHWRVFDGDLAILELSDQPGPILSTAMPPPGAKPVTHEFLSATALDASHEDTLRRLLVGSKSVDEFIRALEGAGYRVVPE